MDYLSGLMMMASLIVALGAQNVFVLRQGVLRQHTGLVILVCIISDVLLVAVGVAGLGRLINEVPWLMTAARWGGALFLLTYAGFAVRRVVHPSPEGLAAGLAEADSLAEADFLAEADSLADGDRGNDNGGAGNQRRSVMTVVRPSRELVAILLQTLAFTWLNPGVYLDTVVLVGSVAATHGDARWIFAAGAMTASVVWFLALGYGAQYLGKWLRTPRAWQYLDGGIAAILVLVAVLLIKG